MKYMREQEVHGGSQVWVLVDCMEVSSKLRGPHFLRKEDQDEVEI